MQLVLISLWFQALWFLAVLGRGEYQYLMISLTLATYFWAVKRRQLSVRFAAFVVLAGVGIDSLNIYLGLLQFSSGHFPLWLAGLWLIFAWYCWQIKALVIRTPVIYVLIAGAFGGALSYMAGYKLGAVDWPLMQQSFLFSQYITLAVLFLEWFLLSFVLSHLLKRQESS